MVLGGGDQIIRGPQVGALTATLIEILLYYLVGCFKIFSLIGYRKVRMTMMGINRRIFADVIVYIFHH